MSTHRVKSMLAVVVLAAAQAVLGADPGWKAGTPLPDLASFGVEGAVPPLKGKVVVIDFWASWCGPCRASFPVLEALHNTYKDKGVVLLGINMDKDAPKMAGFLAEHPVTFPVVRDAAQKVARTAKVPAMPTTVIVGRDGIIREVHAGFSGKDPAGALKEAIEKVLNEGGN